jgi:hypothetical protein
MMNRPRNGNPGGSDGKVNDGDVRLEASRTIVGMLDKTRVYRGVLEFC